MVIYHNTDDLMLLARTVKLGSRGAMTCLVKFTQERVAFFIYLLTGEVRIQVRGSMHVYLSNFHTW